MDGGVLPSRELEALYIHGFLVGVYRESQASEHTARKNAMDNASSNGEELLAKLDIEYNRGRQAKITQEISEIIGPQSSWLGKVDESCWDVLGMGRGPVLPCFVEFLVFAFHLR